MKASMKKQLNEAINGFTFETGNVRGLAVQLTTALLHAQAGKNPYKLAWDIAKSVGREYGPKFKAADVIKHLDEFKELLSQAPEYDEEYFREQGIKGSASQTHEDHVENGRKGAESYTSITS